jgi:hypothetical protein
MHGGPAITSSPRSKIGPPRISESPASLIAPIRVINQQDIGQRNAINIPHLTFRSILCRNIVGEELLCRSRLSWGVPVPKPGYEGKVFYVWFDAPIGYIAATQEWSDHHSERRGWRRWWLDAQDVRYLQFLAKNNVPSKLSDSSAPWPAGSSTIDRASRSDRLRGDYCARVEGACR